MSNEGVSTTILLKAVQFAAVKHQTQRRKGVDASPYINHPIEVAHLLADVGGVTDLSTLVAAIANAIATELGGLKGNTHAIAETIENNVRRKILKEHLNAPAFYEKMSTLLDEIIADRKAKAIAYEEYLKRIAALAQRVEAGLAEETPEPLKRSPALRALYNNLKIDGVMTARADRVAESHDRVLELALAIDQTVKRVRPDGWRGIQTRENVIKGTLLPLLGNDRAEVERMFLIITAQSEY